MSVVLPVVLTVLLFLWEGMRFGNPGTALMPCLLLAGMLVCFRSLPFRRISPRQAIQIYAWFLFASAVVAYLDYEVMTAERLSWADRSQDDCGKFFDAVATDRENLHFNDPGFELLLRVLWGLLSPFGEPNYLGLLNCVMVLSSIFAACCLEVANYAVRNTRVLPYLFLFNPTVIGFNSMLLRDILVGAVGWTAVLCGVALLSKEKRLILADAWWVVAFAAGAAAAFFLRTVSGGYFIVAMVAMAIVLNQRVSKLYLLVLVPAIALVIGLIAEGTLARSGSYVETALAAEGRVAGSVGSWVISGGLLPRYLYTIGGTFVYGLPFWRISLPVGVVEVLGGGGSLFAQVLTALPLLAGIILLVRRPRISGYVLLAVYFGWCFLSALMLQNHTRYITSHLLPVIIAIAAVGWDAVWTQRSPARFFYHALLLLVFAALQVLIVVLKASL